LPKPFQPQEAICLDNDKTKERLRIKIETAEPELEKWEKIALVISRYPFASAKMLIAGKEFYQKTIYLSKELKLVTIF
jgi:hypothetical protein